MKDIPDSDPIWPVLAYYLGQCILNLTLTLSPERIAIGGGILNRKILLPMVRKEFLRLLNNYVQHPLLKNPDKYLIYPMHYPDNGAIAAILYGLSDHA